MDHSFWQSRWGKGQIGFHRAEVNPNLLRHLDVWLGGTRQTSRPRSLQGERVFVPLAGKTVDVTWLAAHGASVVAAEFVPQAVESYFAEINRKPRQHHFDKGVRCVASLRDDNTHASQPDAQQPGVVEFLVADFFALTQAHVGPVTCVYDRAALVAVSPERRPTYAAQLAELTPPGARLLLISFTHDLTSGPPFSVPPQLVRELLSPWFTLTLLADDDITEQEPRYKDRGMSFVREHAWLGVRKG